MPTAMSHSQADHAGFPKAPDDNQYALQTIWEHEMGQKSIPVKHDKTSVLMLSFNPDDDDLSVTDEVSSARVTISVLGLLTFSGQQTSQCSS